VRVGSEMLYDILTDGSLERSKGLVIVCSKSDISGKAVKPDKVQTAITKELERLRTTRGTLGM
jgi:Signal recognition particle receptor beta subunit